MKEAAIGICKKCGIKFYLHKHHILPKSVFGKNGETIELCPNCHTHYHEYYRKNVTDRKNEEEARKIWNIWFRTVSIIITSIVGLILYLFA